MKKKILLFFLLLFFLAYVFWIYLQKEEAINNAEQEQNLLVKKLSSPSYQVSPSLQNQKYNQPKAQKMQEDQDANFEAFDKMEREWLAIVEKIIPQDKLVIYRELRERSEKEKMQAYKEYHNYLRLKHGDKFSYNLSQDQSVAEKKINARYQKDLLSLIGEEKYKDYLKAKDEFNFNLKRQAKLVIEIEF